MVQGFPEVIRTFVASVLYLGDTNIEGLISRSNDPANPPEYDPASVLGLPPALAIRNWRESDFQSH
jgi:hypothetical protein